MGHRSRVAAAALLVLAAGGYVLLEPWHGAAVVSLSEQHGVDIADLPAVPLLILALVLLRTGTDRRPWRVGRVAVLSAIVLGAVLVAGLLDPRIGSALVPAGGGTFGGATEHVDGRRSEPVGRWTHLAVTYDGRSYRLYFNGVEASSGAASGRILHTTDPLWIGGNRPYGEYFRGVVDDVRVYRRALASAEVRAAMTAPAAPARGLVAAYGFDAGRGTTAADASGHGNAGTVEGGRWTPAGRFGGGIAFARAGDTVRVPASRSLDLADAMTLMAWIKPSERQDGWRTIIARQTDAYYLAAGGGRETAHRLEQIDKLRFVVVIALLAWLAFLLARGEAPWTTVRSGRWYWLIALYLSGSVVDVALTPVDTLIGPALVAVWCTVTASRREERRGMAALALLFAVVTIVAIADQGALPLPEDAGGEVRAAALGLLLATAAMLSGRARRASRAPLV